MILQALIRGLLYTAIAAGSTIVGDGVGRIAYFVRPESRRWQRVLSFGMLTAYVWCSVDWVNLALRYVWRS